MYRYSKQTALVLMFVVLTSSCADSDVNSQAAHDLFIEAQDIAGELKVGDSVSSETANRLDRITTVADSLSGDLSRHEVSEGCAPYKLSTKTLSLKLSLKSVLDAKDTISERDEIVLMGVLKTKADEVEQYAKACLTKFGNESKQQKIGEDHG